MERFVAYDKEDFVGKAATAKRKQEGVALKLVYLTVDAADADCMGNEPVTADGRIIGVTTSGGYGHAVGRSIAFAYVEPGHAAPGASFDITILGEARRATVVAEPLYDPRNERLRA